LILDAGPTSMGLESTIVRIVGRAIEILRPGAVTEEELARIAPTQEVTALQEILAPGQTASHYAPNKPVHLFESSIMGAIHDHDALICWGLPGTSRSFWSFDPLAKHEISGWRPKDCLPC
jgi:L-threonylcarbamoyladenylate synthase